MRLDIENLSVGYGGKAVLRSVGLSLNGGEVLAILGANGAGKTTLFRSLLHFVKPLHGSVSLDGQDIGKLTRRQLAALIAYVPQCHNCTFPFRVADIVAMGRNPHIGRFGEPAGKEYALVEETLKTLGIGALGGRYYRSLSGGEKQLVLIARALVHTPRILFLDEPTTGLDPQTRKNVWDTIRRLQRDTGMTIFLTTHYMEEAADSDYVVIIDNGEIAAKGTPAELKSTYADDVLRLFSKDDEALRKALDGEYEYKQVADQVILRLPSTLSALPIVEKCREYIQGFEVMRGTMDDAFIRITGKEIRE